MPSNWLEQIYEERKQELFRFLYVLLGDKQSAEDALQDTFLKAYLHRNKYIEMQQEKAWLYQIARNTAYDMLRKRRREFPIEKEQINDAIEKMLYEAQEKLPTTSLEWRVSDMAEKRIEKKRIYMNKAVAACVAFVMLLGVGGVTVLANMEINIDPGNYSQWVDIRSEMDWDDYEQFMEKRGFVLPENFADYKYDNYRTLLVAKKGRYLLGCTDKECI